MSGRAGALIVAIAMFATACNVGSGLDPIAENTTTTSTTAAGEPTTTSSTSTLPPLDNASTGTVVAIIDGDTFVARVDGAEVDVRLLDINAPELDECSGDGGRSALAELLANPEVVMVATEEAVDGNGRQLRYVYVDDGGVTTFVNRAMVAQGFAVAVQTGREFDAEFKALEDRAWASGKGMWGTYVCGQPEGGAPDRPQIRIAKVSPNPAGDDNEALGDEQIEIVNEGYGTVSLAGWLVRDESSSNRLTLPSGTGLNPGDVLTVVTGCGSGSGDTVYWCSDTPVWSNGGDTVILQDQRGNVVHRLVYGPDDVAS